MPRLKNLPGLDIIKGFRGIIDFGVTRGVPYARSWPRTPPHHRTAGTIAASFIFGEVAAAYRLLAPELRPLLEQEAADQPVTPRDIYVKAVYGYLHEVNMSDYLTLLQSINDHLATLEALPHLEGIVEEALEETNLPAGTFPLPGTPVPAGQIWVITEACLSYSGTPPTFIQIQAMGLANFISVLYQTAPTSDQQYFFSGELLLQEGDYMRAVVIGATAGDDLFFKYAGYRLNAP